MGKEKRKISKRKMSNVKLTKFELLHLRDLLSVKLPPRLSETVSQRLAATQARPLVEARLWLKIATACQKKGIPVDDDAPDFVVSIVQSIPEISVFQVSDEPAGSQDDDDDSDDEVNEGPVDEGNEFMNFLHSRKTKKKKKSKTEVEDELLSWTGFLCYLE